MIRAVDRFWLIRTKGQSRFRSRLGGNTAITIMRPQNSSATSAAMLTPRDRAHAADRRGLPFLAADGAIVVGQSNSALGSETFIWDAQNGMQAVEVLLSAMGLDLTGWDLDHALSISADGLTIMGTGTNPSGFTEGWIAVIPEPGTALLLGLGLIALSVRNRREG